MSKIIPFDTTSKLPAHLSALFAVSDDLTANAGGGLTALSIKGKAFHIVKGDERTLVTSPNDPDAPATSLEVVLLKANPNLSKVYYASGYEEGANTKPTCYSHDGLAPAMDAESRQASKCAICKHNQWGSKTTENGKKGKACSDSRRVAVAAAGAVNEPMLLRIPAASLASLADYGNSLKKRGVPYQAVVTKMSFDFGVSHPQLTFKPVGFLDEHGVKQVQEALEDGAIDRILGASIEAEQGNSADEFAAPAAKGSDDSDTDETPVQPPKPAPKTNRDAVHAEAEKAAKAAPAKVAVEVAEPKVASGMDDDLSALLASAGFDD